jgi:hypothetical protein
MRGYGLPRNDDVQSPDAADLRAYGLKASRGMIAGPGGARRSAQKAAKKARARRIWKGAARRAGHAEVRAQLAD